MEGRTVFRQGRKKDAGFGAVGRIEQNKRMGVKQMKDRIGGTPKKKKPAARPVSQPVLQEERPAKGGGSMDPKRIGVIVGVILVIIAAIFGGKALLGKGGQQGGVKEPTVTYEPAGDGITQEMQDEMDLMFETKRQHVPTLKELEDTIAIRELAGELESGDDGVNPHVTAGQENLTAQVAEFKSSTNDDTVGWLKIPETNIDYAVVHKAGAENALYYESKGYDKNYSKDGVLWADYENTFPEMTPNTIIYGHNWYNIYDNPRTPANAQANDVMFGQLMSFHHTSFAQQVPFIYFSTEEKDYVYQIFAAYYTEETFPYYYAQLPREQMQEVLAEALKKSRHNYNVNVTTQDEILTLSTCTRTYPSMGATQRFVVMAKRVPEGTASTTISSHTNYMDPRM